MSRQNEDSVFEKENPFVAPRGFVAATEAERGSFGLRLFLLCCSGIAGVLIGCFLSVELLQYHFPVERRTASDVFGHLAVAVLSSPVSMSIGVLPTVSFYGPHGIMVIPGALTALVSGILYARKSGRWLLGLVFVGCILWSHNNLLSWHALMSV